MIIQFVELGVGTNVWNLESKSQKTPHLWTKWSTICYISKSAFFFILSIIWYPSAYVCNRHIMDDIGIKAINYSKQLNMMPSSNRQKQINHRKFLNIYRYYKLFMIPQTFCKIYFAYAIKRFVRVQRAVPAVYRIPVERRWCTDMSKSICDILKNASITVGWIAVFVHKSKINRRKYTQLLYDDCVFAC